ncbi:hypothetical protein [Dyadobacter alkalitolerans]|uniref:hypothetical protein n=1 Tax=Dyadobacter alkalitolerans TaxID=492736 RepID=UPI0003F6BAD8|nr:hypothetical protein [Dyadobacter alkalitolerans]
MKKYLNWVIVPMIILLASCEKSDRPSVDPYQYVPTSVGQFVISDIEEHIYSAGKDQPVVKKWQEKDQVIKNSVDSESITTLIFSRSVRTSETAPWEKSKEYSVKVYPDKVLTTVDNRTDMNLIFPLNGQTEWNGNTYHNADAQKYHYESLNKHTTVSKLSFDNSITVVERRDSSAINQYVGIKKYALGVGLIFDDQIAYEYCQTEECFASDIKKIESGYHRVKMVSQFGTVK